MSGTNTTELARELATLDGTQHQFGTLVKQIIDGHRQMGSARIMSRPGTQADAVAREMATLDSALEKMEHNLRSQYAEFFETHVKFKAHRLTAGELAEFVEALRSEGVQKYFSKMMALQEESTFIFRQFAENMVRQAVAGERPS